MKQIKIGAMRYDKRTGEAGQVVSVYESRAVLWTDGKRVSVPWKYVSTRNGLRPAAERKLAYHRDSDTFSKKPADTELGKGWVWV